MVWVSVTAERALYADRGRDVILCDRLPSPVELVLCLTDEQWAHLRFAAPLMTPTPSQERHG